MVAAMEERIDIPRIALIAQVVCEVKIYAFSVFFSKNSHLEIHEVSKK